MQWKIDGYHFQLKTHAIVHHQLTEGGFWPDWGSVWGISFLRQSSSSAFSFHRVEFAESCGVLVRFNHSLLELY